MALLDDVGIGAINSDDPQKQIESVVKQTNEALRQISNEDRTKIVKDDSGTPRYLQGFQDGGFENGNVGLKVSQEGVDVTTATADQLIWSTDFNNFKIVGSGTITIPACSITTAATSYAFNNGETTTIAHGLSFTPAIIAFWNNGGSFLPLPWTTFSTVSAGAFSIFNIRVTVDATNVSGVIDGMAYNIPGGVTFSASTAKYYLLRETAA